MDRTWSWLRRVLSVAAVAVVPAASATPFQIVIDSSSLAGSSVQLALDLVDGGAPANTVSITAFSTDAILGASNRTGDVIGTLPGRVTLADTSFFAEYLQSLVLGHFLVLTIDTSGAAPDPAGFPDSLTAFLLDPVSGLPLFPTTDPTGADALFLLDIGVNALPDVYSGRLPVLARPVLIPEPASVSLLICALLVLLAVRRTEAPRPHA